jgi:hypothetical protein
MQICPDCGETFPSSPKARHWRCWCIRKPKAIQRLLSRRQIVPNGCWIYLGPNSGKGYGAFATKRLGKSTRNAHRSAYILFIGDIPHGMEVHHECGNRLCFNPTHLSLKAVQPHRALHNSKTHCRHGHEYDLENTYYFRGSKKCRICHRLREQTKRRVRGILGRFTLRTNMMCKKGHHLTGRDIGLHKKKGGEFCKICKRECEQARLQRVSGLSTFQQPKAV